MWNVVGWSQTHGVIESKWLTTRDGHYTCPANNESIHATWHHGMSHVLHGLNGTFNGLWFWWCTHNTNAGDAVLVLGLAALNSQHITKLNFLCKCDSCRACCSSCFLVSRVSVIPSTKHRVGGKQQWIAMWQA